MASITSIVKASDWILSRPTLSKVIIPVAKTFCAYAGYREMGLKLPEDQLYARNFRTLTAHQLSLSHQLLPPNKAVQPEEDTHYLIPYLLEAEKEAFEKAELDQMKV
ncbi:ubiquinol-cytochrome c reductase subunit 7 [Metschnikowia aff. pulcherrima]|uniref:Cytochrome b-c1 complex subunit 7 n=1 Tax=Metschnikowia aff. pulcherrima TaxID=2163413 RepID=A0A4P6XUQ1_9ASCO|nr:ubiquinol-cytochrome c reductase subunit 7 [Metschnikowia aff. pulcherrima]